MSVTKIKRFCDIDTSDVIFDVNLALSLEAVDHKFLRLGAVIPALGINDNDLRMSFGYKLVSPTDFEVVAEATIAGTPRKAVLKFRLVQILAPRLSAKRH
jgi:hypothetical protein